MGNKICYGPTISFSCFFVLSNKENSTLVIANKRASNFNPLNSFKITKNKTQKQSSICGHATLSHQQLPTLPLQIILGQPRM